MDDQSDDLRSATPRRLEILMSGSGRRRWPDALKAQIVAESFAPEAVVADVARRHGARSSQVFGWRKAAREGLLALPAENDRSVVNFAPVVITEASPRARQRSSPPNTPDVGAIEIKAMGVAVRIGGSADVVLVEAIVRALRA